MNFIIEVVRFRYVIALVTVVLAGGFGTGCRFSLAGTRVAPVLLAGDRDRRCRSDLPMRHVAASAVELVRTMGTPDHHHRQSNSFVFHSGHRFAKFHRIYLAAISHSGRRERSGALRKVGRDRECGRVCLSGGDVAGLLHRGDQADLGRHAATRRTIFQGPRSRHVEMPLALSPGESESVANSRGTL